MVTLLRTNVLAYVEYAVFGAEAAALPPVEMFASNDLKPKLSSGL